jgi:predicted nucleic acid-binding protein
VILIDTGPLVAAALHGDANHVRCVEFFTAAHLNAEPLLVPSLVVTEVCYLVARESGPRLEAEFLRSLAAGDFQLTEPTSADPDRAADLVTTYADFPLGAVDATVIAIAERLAITEIATLDHRHFAAVRPRHTNALTLRPD